MISILLAIIYMSFISLGLPDSLLGSAWPVIYKEFNVPLSWSGIVFMIISAGTIISSLQSDRITKKLGAGKVTAISVATTAIALFGFSVSHSYWQLCLWAIPYGLGAGSVDAALNNYVALHFKSHHMSWLHCMWGVGATTGPLIMSCAITSTGSWNNGYKAIAIMQVCLSVLIFISLPVWKKFGSKSESPASEYPSAKPMPLKDVFKIKGAKQIMTAFFCYCALEQTVCLWASSYLVIYKKIPENIATTFASLFFIGITVGRALNGFLTFKFSNSTLIRAGQAIILAGIILVLIPFTKNTALAGFVLMGLGCAPIYPCIIHSTPVLFGRENSQAIVGVQMASAYAGTCIMPPIFGLIANHINIALLPVYLLLLLVLQFVMYNKVQKECVK